MLSARLGGVLRALRDFWRGEEVPPPPRYPLDWCTAEHREWCGQFGDCLWNCWDIEPGEEA